MAASSRDGPPCSGHGVPCIAIQSSGLSANPQGTIARQRLPFLVVPAHRVSPSSSSSSQAWNRSGVVPRHLATKLTSSALSASISLSASVQK